MFGHSLSINSIGIAISRQNKILRSNVFEFDEKKVRKVFLPKIYNDHEKAYRLVVAQIIKRMGALNFLWTDELKTQTGQLGVYHNRLPATKPNCVGYEPASYKSINVWAGISSVGHTRPVVCFKFLMKCVLIIN